MTNLETHEELFDLIKEYCNDNPTEVVEFTNQIINDINDSPHSFIALLSKEVEDYAERNYLCNVCGNELRVIHSREESEYEGFPVYEEIDENYCDYCEEYR